jgi:hypothetical protein
VSEIQCFVIEPTGRAEYWLHRSTNYTDAQGNKIPERVCPKSSYGGGHFARALAGIVSIYQDEEGLWRVPPDDDEGLPDHSDPRWPQECKCGYRFQESDGWSAGTQTLYRRPAAGQEFKIRDAPPGAMWYADWMKLSKDQQYEGPGKFIGPDGHCLSVMLPDGQDWIVDGPASNGPGWTRTGTPPNVTATPSIGRTREDGSWIYHGWLRDGKLIDA